MQNWSEEAFLIKKVKNTIPWIYVISNLNGEKIAGLSYEKELQKSNQKKFRVEKVIKTKGDKIYFKWKGWDSFFKSWTDKEWGKAKLELDLSNYAIKSWFKKSNRYWYIKICLKGWFSKLKIWSW